jgi:D-methionine transport system substrate-binding protein
LFASTIRVGVVSKFDNNLVEVIKDQNQDLKIQIIKYDNIEDSNKALIDKEIDINLFQTLDYLNAYNSENKSSLRVVAKEYVEPIGIYSKLHNSIKDIDVGALVVIPSDLSSNSRSLKFLSEIGLLEFPPNKDTVTKDDIVENYFNIDIVEVEASKLPRFLEFADYVVLSGESAFDIGYIPKYDSLFLETVNPKYTSVVVTRKENIENTNIINFVKKIKSKETELFILKNYEDNIYFIEK